MTLSPPERARWALAASVGLYAATLPLSISAANASWVLVAISLAFLMRVERRLPSWRLNGMEWVFTAYVAVGVLTAALGVKPAHSLHRLHSDFHMLWLVLLFTAVFSMDRLANTSFAFAAGYGTAAIWGISQPIISYLSVGEWGMARGGVHHITYGEHMVIALTGGVAALIFPPWESARDRSGAGRNRKSSGHRAWIVVFCLLVGAALLFSQARGPWLAFCVSLMTIAVLRKESRPIVAALVLLGAAFLVLSPKIALPFYERFRSIFNPEQHANAVRLELWRIAWSMFRDHPLTGVGPGNYATLFNVYHPGPVGENTTWSQVHNMYLHVLAERGVIGLAALLVLFGAMWWRAFIRYRENQNFWSLWCLAALTGFCVMNITQNSFHTAMIWMSVTFLWIWCERIAQALKSTQHPHEER